MSGREYVFSIAGLTLVTSVIAALITAVVWINAQTRTEFEARIATLHKSIEGDREKSKLDDSLIRKEMRDDEVYIGDALLAMTGRMQSMDDRLSNLSNQITGASQRIASLHERVAQLSELFVSELLPPREHRHSVDTVR